MAKKSGLFIRLVSTAGTGYFLVKKKTSKKLAGTDTKLEFKKYDPVVRKHVVFKEQKMK
ncbi:MAG: 50S ribosomal protein L33 [Alphaproteobacteria bacterium]|jgi:large subunit ribosomal protein L33